MDKDVENHGLSFDSICDTISSTLTKVVDGLDQANQEKIYRNILHTGCEEFDGILGSMHEGQLITIFSRNSNAHLDLAQNIVLSISRSRTISSVFVCIAKQAEHIAWRLIANMGELDIGKLYRQNLDNEDWVKITEAISKIAEIGIYTITPASLTLPDLREKLKWVKIGHDVSIAVIDNIDMLKSGLDSVDEYGNRRYLLRELKSIASELQISLLVLSNYEYGNYPANKDHLAYSDQVLEICRASKPGSREVAINVIKNNFGGRGSFTMEYYAEYCKYKCFKVEPPEK